MKTLLILVPSTIQILTHSILIPSPTGVVNSQKHAMHMIHATKMSINSAKKSLPHVTTPTPHSKN